MLLTLPLELLDTVLENVDDPGDLAALCAVCKDLKQIISPGKDLGPLECRHLSVPHNNERCFLLLADKPKLARDVWRLCIPEYYGPYHGRFCRKWTWSVDSQFNNCTLLIIRDAVRRMSNLQFLACEVDFASAPIWNPLFESICTGCPTLKEVCLLFGPRKNVSNSLPAATNLRGRAHQPGAVGITRTAFESFIDSMASGLTRCGASLRHLALTWNTYDLDPLFKIRLPSLVSLSLVFEPTDSFDGSSYSSNMITFLDRHSTLEYLLLDEVTHFGLGLDSLPLLKEAILGFHDFDEWMLSPLSSGCYRPLRRIDLEYFYNRGDLAGVIFPDFSNVTTLRGVCLSKYVKVDWVALSVLARATPNLSELYWGGKPPHEGRTEAEQLTKLLNLFPKLLSLQRYFRTSTCSNEKQTAKTLCEAGLLNSTLRCVDDWVRGEGNVWRKDNRAAQEWKWKFWETRPKLFEYGTPMSSLFDSDDL
ncbi:hypothetical protein CALVIDRAFT_557534 [Calocera viscosa TUFC12733]|uniref:F-box domain-containing protein n=1 Tax=Calocera viscosa (strain TUFC12733) TaxID=1330018 RepID=A0A167IA18_CALVF|nr:hypothetical protein CALVIDRAFT_557534 [Calocera viscosa TUFC12733]